MWRHYPIPCNALSDSMQCIIRFHAMHYPWPGGHLLDALWPVQGQELPLLFGCKRNS